MSGRGPLWVPSGLAEWGYIYYSHPITAGYQPVHLVPPKKEFTLTMEIVERPTGVREEKWALPWSILHTYLQSTAWAAFIL